MPDRSSPLVPAANEHPLPSAPLPGPYVVGYVVRLGGTMRLVGKQAESLARIAA